MAQNRVAIVMGSDSDLPVMIEAYRVLLKEFKIDSHVDIVSAHRTPKKMFDFAEHAHEKGFKIIIAGAGGAAHLPGMIAAISPLPVIGVPVQSKTLSGWDSLLSIAQMPPGIPVATMAINGARNAGILAASMLHTMSHADFADVLMYKASLEAEVNAKSKKLLEMGPEAYLEQMLKK